MNAVLAKQKLLIFLYIIAIYRKAYTNNGIHPRRQDYRFRRSEKEQIKS